MDTTVERKCYFPTRINWSSWDPWKSLMSSTFDHLHWTTALLELPFAITDAFLNELKVRVNRARNSGTDIASTLVRRGTQYPQDGWLQVCAPDKESLDAVEKIVRELVKEVAEARGLVGLALCHPTLAKG